MSNKHLHRALFWKFIWSYKRKTLFMILFTFIPIFGIYIYGKILNKGVLVKHFNETITHPQTPEDILKSSYVMTDIMYTPEGNATKFIMESVRKKLKHSSLTSLQNEEEVEKRIVEEYKKIQDKKIYIENLTYGVIFQTVTKHKFHYSLRSTEGRVWHTDERYPRRQTPGPMDAGRYYFRLNFIALQIAINSAYLEYLGVAEKNWSFQEFPYPDYAERKPLDEQIFSYIVAFLLYVLLFYMLANIADEKKSGARAIMLLNGVKLHQIYVYWIIFFFLPTLIAITFMTILAVQYEIINYTSPFLFWLLLFINAITSMALIFALSSLLNPTFAQLAFLFPQMIIMILIFALNFKTVSPLGILTAFVPAGSLAQGIGTIAFYEHLGVGLQFRDMTTIIKASRFSPYLFITLAPLVTMVFLMLLSVYMELVKPGEYGKAKPWYFILPECMTGRLRARKEIAPQSRRPSAALVEEKTESEGEIRVRNLKKVFKNFTAVNNLSVDFYKDQITALLGHNGAGKTTFLYTITGIISPTSGEIFYKEYDVLLNFSEFRESFGFCPQRDIVINDLSVKEQVLFFGMVKKMSKVESMEFVNSFFTKLNMNEKQNALPKKLSGGMKRKLCLAIAVVNNPPVLFMDEPSSGLDPESRRSLWDIILELRKDRTIVITTHFMEEADILGDRIAIMANGELRCIGSPIFLKKHYGFGHSISINYKNTPEEMISFVNSYVKATNKVDLNMKQITFNVPMEETSNLSSLFSALEPVVDKNRISVNCTSMESVFLKVQEGEGITTEFDESDIEFVVKERPKNKGGAKFFQQLGSLVHIRVLSLKHGWFLYITTLLLIPILMTIFVMSTVNYVLDDYLAMDVSALLDLSFYGSTDVLIDGLNQNITKSFRTLVENQGSSAVIAETSVFDELMSAAENDDADFRDNYVVAGEFKNGSSNIFYSSMAYHSVPIAVNLYYNSFLYPKSSISITNHPYTFATPVCDNSIIFRKMFVWGLLAITTLICMCTFNHFPTKERRFGIKHLQYMAELNPITYWISNIILDIALCFGTVMIITLIIFAADAHGLYRRSDVIIGFFLLFFVFSFTIILWGYLLSIIIPRFEISMMVIVFVVTGIALVSLILLSFFESSGPYLFWFNLLTPFRVLINGILYIEKTATLRHMCERCSNYEEALCQEKNEFFVLKEEFFKNILWMLVHSAILIYILILLEIKMFRYLEYLCTRRWYKETQEDLDDDVQREKDAVEQYVAGKPWKNPERADVIDSNTVKSEASGMLNERIVYTALVDSPPSTSIPSTDSTILTEASAKTSVDGVPVVVVDKLTKMYSSTLVAADRVTFAAMKGECFGLLGVSGAGKSTVFSMLSGRVYPTAGNAFIIENDQRYKLKFVGFEFISKMGYCPQEHWIYDQLTARQLMTHFANLRGVKKNTIKDNIGWWIKILDLHNYCDKPCGTYSGGNKRKLSTALALIGKPIIILLDEPTTGVDPVTRRKLWQVFKLVKNTDQTMILSSHSMDECEAVCNRLTIMAKGKMRCIGEINYLKNKHAQGCTILIKFDIDSPPEIVEKILQSIMSIFGENCELTDQQKGFLHFNLNRKRLKWSFVFAKMEKIKKNFNEIEEYMLSATSLEKIFLSFANK